MSISIDDVLDTIGLGFFHLKIYIVAFLVTINLMSSTSAIGFMLPTFIKYWDLNLFEQVYFLLCFIYLNTNFCNMQSFNYYMNFINCYFLKSIFNIFFFFSSIQILQT